MTSPARRPQHLSKVKRPPLRKMGAAYMCVFMLVLFFKNSDAASLWVSEGLKLCASKLIPSLFPFMVVSSLMVSSGAGTAVFKIFEKPVRAVFGVGRECCAPIMLGWLCGFPVGARCASELYRDGRINSSEYTRSLCISSTPSPAFLIGTVGKGMLNDASLGVCLYALSILSCIAVGLFMRLVSKSTPQTLSKPQSTQKRAGLAQSLTKAVTDSAVGMLYVCAFVVFFSAFLGAFEGALSFLHLSDTASALLFSFFEMTSGISRISKLSGNVLPLCALAAGWSGLSVHFQTAAMCTSKGTRFAPYILSHVAKAAICGTVATIFCLL